MKIIKLTKIDCFYNLISSYLLCANFVFCLFSWLYSTSVYAVVDYSSKDISNYDFTSGENAQIDLRGGIFKMLIGANNANFTNRDLTGANFWNALNSYGDASGAIFKGAILYNVDFTRTKLSDVDFTDAHIGIDESVGQTGTSFFGMIDSQGGFSASQLYSTASWKEKNLNGVRIGGSILSGWNFSGQSLKSSAFKSVTFNCDTNATSSNNPNGATDFSNANLTNASFEASIFSYDSATQISSVKFDGADLSGANFNKANLTGVDFSKTSSIKGITIDSATLIGVNLSGLDLTTISLIVASTFEGANFSNSNLSGKSLKTSNFTNVNFSGANLSGAVMTSSTIIAGAKFAYADLGGIDFSSTDTSLANFENSYIDGYYIVNPNENIILETDLKRTVLNSSFTKDVIVNTASYKNATLRLIDFTGYDLSNWDFSNIDLSGSKFNNAKFSDKTKFDGAILGVWTSLWNCTANGFTYDMLTKTKSWNNSLRGVRFGQNDIRNWDFSNQDLRDTDWAKAQVTNTNFAYADLRGVLFERLPADINSALYKNTIYIDGVIKNYSMSTSNDILIVRPHGLYTVKIAEDASISGGATFKYSIDVNGRNCFIEIASGKTFAVKDSVFELWLEDGFSLLENTTFDLILSSSESIVYSGIQKVNIYNADGSLYDGTYDIIKNAGNMSIKFIAEVPEASIFALIVGLIALPIAILKRNNAKK